MIATVASSIFGAMTIASLAMIVWGFRLSFKSLNDVTKWFVRGFGLIALGYMLRGFYWDVFWQIFRYLDRESAYSWSEMVGGTAINVVFYLIVLVGVYCVLKSREAMIEEEERHRWPWWKAWMHPDTLRIIRWPSRR